MYIPYDMYLVYYIYRRWIMVVVGISTQDGGTNSNKGGRKEAPIVPTIT